MQSTLAVPIGLSSSGHAKVKHLCRARCDGRVMQICLLRASVRIVDWLV